MRTVSRVPDKGKKPDGSFTNGTLPDSVPRKADVIFVSTKTLFHDEAEEEIWASEGQPFPIRLWTITRCPMPRSWSAIPITKGSISDVQFTFIYRQGSVKSEELSHLCSGCLACRHGWMDEYRQRAAEAKNRAAQTSNPSIKSAFEEVARGWLLLAEQTEWIELTSSLRDEDTSN